MIPDELRPAPVFLLGVLLGMSLTVERYSPRLRKATARINALHRLMRPAVEGNEDTTTGVDVRELLEGLARTTTSDAPPKPKSAVELRSR